MQTTKTGMRAAGAKVAALFMALCMVSGMQAIFVPQASAAPAEKYTYTITVSAADGHFRDGVPDARDSKTVVITGLNYNDSVNLSAICDYAEPAESKYYVRGVRLAGLDNSAVDEPTFTVTGDAQYVIAYGLKKDQVAYTVNFVDADGNAIAESQTYLGNVGDKPVVAYVYIEGYQPQALNLTKTLSDNADENVFTFEYTPVEGTRYVTVQQPGGFANNTASLVLSPALAEDASSSDATTTDGEQTVEGEEGAQAGENGEAGAVGPAQLIDLDDQETPLASGAEAGAAATQPANAFNATAVYIIAGIVAAVFVLALLLAILHKRKKEQARS